MGLSFFYEQPSVVQKLIEHLGASVKILEANIEVKISGLYSALSNNQ